MENNWIIIDNAPENVVLLTKTEHFRSAHKYETRMVKKNEDWFVLTDRGDLKSFYIPTHYRL